MTKLSKGINYRKNYNTFYTETRFEGVSNSTENCKGNYTIKRLQELTYEILEIIIMAKECFGKGTPCELY